MARRKFIFATVLFFSCFGISVFFIKLHLMDLCTFCHKKEEVEFLFDYDLDTTEPEDDIENGTFLSLPNIDCKKTPPYLVILITTTYNQQDARRAIRNTWGKQRTVGDKLVVSFYLLGIKKHQSTKEKHIFAVERNMYKDFIQKDFVDVYSNLTYKTLMGMEWISNHCPETNFVMKTDTDVFVNTYFLVEKLVQKNQTTNFFTGFLKSDEHPIRSIFSKWYVTTKEFQEHKYPPFCSGTGYVFSADVAQKIHNISATVPYFKLEDVYTGICLQKLQIPLQELHTKQTFFPEKLFFSVCNYRNIVTSHEVKPHEIRIYWEAMERTNEESC